MTNACQSLIDLRLEIPQGIGMITALSIPLQHNGGLWTNLSVLIFSFLGLLAITADAFIVEKNKPMVKGLMVW
ncbi:MAG: hypothetical protein CML56_09175 [Rhodobacteraceae bacterium]|nr:hypothetical protein [Paracoccaceae bacterium]